MYLVAKVLKYQITQRLKLIMSEEKSLTIFLVAIVQNFNVCKI